MVFQQHKSCPANKTEVKIGQGLATSDGVIPITRIWDVKMFPQLDVMGKNYTESLGV